MKADISSLRKALPCQGGLLESSAGKKAVRVMLDTFELSVGQRTVFLAIMDHLEQIRADWMLENGIPVIGAEK